MSLPLFNVNRVTLYRRLRWANEKAVLYNHPVLRRGRSYWAEMRLLRKPKDTEEEKARARLLAHFEDYPDSVFYSRQLEILFEHEYFHRVTNRALRRLVEEGRIHTEKCFFKGIEKTNPVRGLHLNTPSLVLWIVGFHDLSPRRCAAGRMSFMTSWQIEAGNVAELMANFGAFGISVPSRTEKKDQFAEEVRCLRRYLFPLAHSGFLTFPMTVVKLEAPDFISTWGANTIGLEVTKATEQEFEADLTRFNRQEKTRHYVSDLNTGTMLLGVLGWVGDSVETEWVSFVLDSIAKKLADLASYSIGKCDLLIYDNTPLPAPDLKKAAEGVRLHFVKEPLADKNGQSFRVISVIRDPWLIYDIARKPQELRYDAAWDATAV